MEMKYGRNRELSHGAISILNNYECKDNNSKLFCNFILQIYNCVPLLNRDQFSCSLFDDEYICNKFILKYNINEGRPYKGDIIIITKININILNDGNKLFCCEENKLLEKSAQFLINPDNLNYISSQQKASFIDKKENNVKENKIYINEINKGEENKNIKEVCISEKKRGNINKIIENNNKYHKDNNIRYLKEKENNIILQDNNNVDNNKEKIIIIQDNNNIDKFNKNEKAIIIQDNNNIDKFIKNENSKIKGDSNNTDKLINEYDNKILNDNNNFDKIIKKEKTIILQDNISIDKSQKEENNKLSQDNKFIDKFIEEENSQLLYDNNNNDKIMKEENIKNLEDNTYFQNYNTQSKSKYKTFLNPNKNNQNNLIKIEPKRKENYIVSKENEIMESIYSFISDFEDGINKNSDNNIFEEIKQEESNQNLQEEYNNIIFNFETIKENEKEKSQNEPNTSYESNNINQNKKNNIRKVISFESNNYYIHNINDKIKIKYIEEIKNILKNYKNKPFNDKFKIKARIKTFFHNYDIFYKGCSICHKKLRDNKNCCKNGKEILIYDFYLQVRDASGVVTIFFLGKIGKELLGIDEYKYKDFLDNKQPIGIPSFTEYINDLCNNEYIFTIEFLERKYTNYTKKKFRVIKVEKINKYYRSKIVKELKNILQISQ